MMPENSYAAIPHGKQILFYELIGKSPEMKGPIEHLQSEFPRAVVAEQAPVPNTRTSPLLVRGWPRARPILFAGQTNRKVVASLNWNSHDGYSGVGNGCGAGRKAFGCP